MPPIGKAQNSNRSNLAQFKKNKIQVILVFSLGSSLSVIHYEKKHCMFIFKFAIRMRGWVFLYPMHKVHNMCISS